MIRKIDLSFRITCHDCGHVTVLDPTAIGTEMPSCAGCGEPFSVSHELARAMRRRVEEFLRHIPEE